MHISIFLATLIITAASPSKVFVNPTSPSEVQGAEVYQNLINVADKKNRLYVNVVDADITYDEIRYYALYDCKRSKKRKPQLIDSLIDIEKSFNPAPEMRGMLLAAACMESGYNHKAKGDRKFSKNKKTPMAIGMLQLWPIYEKMYPGLDRTNPQDAAVAWMSHIVKMIPKVKKQCKYRSAKKIWLAAWVTGIRYKKAGGRCKERPLHYKLLKKWHRKIREDRQVAEECAPMDGCGC